MSVYLWVCSTCGRKAQSTNRVDGRICPSGHKMRRDYQSEAVGIGSGVRESRNEFTPSGYRDLFLPTAKELAGPGDPDGQKGIRKWNEEHAPKSDNVRPLRPEYERTQF